MKNVIFALFILLLPAVAIAEAKDNKDYPTPSRNIEEDSAFSLIFEFVKKKLESTENKVIVSIMVLGFFLLLRYPLVGLFMIVAPGTVYMLYVKVISMLN